MRWSSRWSTGPVEGIPDKLGAWLMTVAKRRALNHLSRDANHRAKLALLEQAPCEPDDRPGVSFLLARSQVPDN